MYVTTMLVSLLFLTMCESEGIADQPTQSGDGQLTLFSATVGYGEHLPVDHTCFGANITPDLQWMGVPEATESLVLFVEEAPSSGQSGVHWLVFNIPPTVTQLSAGIVSDSLANLGIVEGTTDFGTQGYNGPCPASGTHQYNIVLMALDMTLGFNHRARYDELALISGGHILAADTLVTFFTSP